MSNWGRWSEIFETRFPLIALIEYVFAKILSIRVADLSRDHRGSGMVGFQSGFWWWLFDDVQHHWGDIIYARHLWHCLVPRTCSRNCLQKVFQNIGVLLSAKARRPVFYRIGMAGYCNQDVFWCEVASKTLFIVMSRSKIHKLEQ